MGAAISMARAIASRRSSIRSNERSGMPAAIASMIASGFSVRGLSLVTMATSANRAATAPISGRLPGSRSPPAPNTTMSRPETNGRSAVSARSRASGVWA